ncbi:MAG: WecB/TagA/CpsF family glycosyltransferase [Actinobacteria bacterium]|nr:WecB/TagA/CpsF family glycosyltransferase [Actinomycetota bacterium]
MNAPARREIIGTPVSMLDYARLLEMIDGAVAARTSLTVCFAPASTLVMARRDAELAAALAAADVVAPDGMGVVKAARLLGENINSRVYGPDLMLMQCERAAASGQRIWLQGGSDDDALAALRAALAQRFPGLLIAGGESPPHRPPTAAELDATVGAINASGAEIVWVGLGSPKQELWMHRLRGRLDAPVLCGVGAAFDFHAGRVAQAPRRMRDHGFEWLYRLSREPLRLGRRYLGTLPHFALLVVLQALRERRDR